MQDRNHRLTLLYALIGTVALIGMWSNVARFVLVAHGTPIEFVRAIVANPAVTMLTIELGCMAVAASLVMYTEARRLRMRGVWIVLFLAITLGFGVVFPFFLAVRQYRGGTSASDTVTPVV